MSKPTKIQIEVCDALIREIGWWKNSNDINSPTHFVDIEDCMKADLGDFLSDNKIDSIIDKLQDLLNEIRNIEK